MRRAIVVTATAAVLLAAAAVAEDFWVTKPYQQWSKQETEKMLKDSPWAQHITLSEVVGNMSGINMSASGAGGTVTGAGAVARNAEAGHATLPIIIYTAQVRSAKPVREAVVRDRQLQQKYDKMSAEQKAALDAKTNSYLQAPQEDIVLYVTYESNAYNDLLRRYWTQQTYDLLKNSVQLKLGKGWLQPTSYAVTNGAFQFTFDRTADLPRDRNIVFQFDHPPIGAIQGQRVVIEFKADKMQLEGAPAM
jgi:hypothetical protein